jgi:hypothetical protein
VIGWLASPSKKGNQDSPSTGHTNSYTAGYQWAYEHHDRYATSVLLQGTHAFCADTATSEAPVQGLNEQQWTQGCEDSFGKMGFGQTPTSTVDCSLPQNLRNGHCF